MFLEHKQLSFNGRSFAVYFTDAYGPFKDQSSTLEIRFRTENSNGIILAAGGTQHDFIVVEIIQGTLQIVYNFGGFFFKSDKKF